MKFPPTAGNNASGLGHVRLAIPQTPAADFTLCAGNAARYTKNSGDLYRTLPGVDV